MPVRLCPFKFGPEITEEVLLSIRSMYPSLRADSSGWISAALSHASYIYQADFPDGGNATAANFVGHIANIGSHFLRLAALHTVNSATLPLSIAACHDRAVVLAAKEQALLIDRLRLREIAAFGGGQQDLIITEQVLGMIGEQLAGALVLSIGYGHFYESFRSRWLSFDSFSSRPDQDSNPKGLVKELAQQRSWNPPQYTVLSKEGPEHCPLFRSRLTVGPYSIETEGGSKKQAEQIAAKILLDRLALPLKKRRVDSPEHLLGLNSRPHPNHHQDVNRIILNLGLVQSSEALVSQAFIHRSYAYENTGYSPYLRLAQIGSEALQAFGWHLGLMTFMEAGLSKIPTVGAFSAVHSVRVEKTSCAEQFDLMGLSDMLLMGSGQMTAGVTASIKADVFQALVGAFVLAAGSNINLDSLPAFILNWYSPLVTHIRRTVQTDSEFVLGLAAGSVETKGRLRHVSALLGLECVYRNETAGPAHKQVFVSHVALFRRSDETVVLFGTGRGTSRTESEQNAARQALDMLGLINRNPSSVSRRAVARFALETMFSKVPSEQRDIEKWSEMNLLGSEMLRKCELASFCEWADGAEELLGSRLDVSMLATLTAFYGRLRASRSIDINAMLVRTINGIGALVQRLDPMGHPCEIQRDSAFGDLLEAGMVSNLLSRHFKRTDLSIAISEFSFLARRKIQNITVTPPEVRITFAEREGRFHSLLDWLTNTIVEAGVNALDLSFRSSSQSALMVVVEWRDSASGDIVTVINRCFERSILWKFLEQDIPVIGREVNPGSLVVTCRLLDRENALATRAVQAFYNCPTINDPQIDVVPQLLHDVKNHFIAYEQAMLGASEGGLTKQLKGRLDASMHLDLVKNIMSAVQSVGVATTEPSFEAFNVTTFLRAYVATKLLAIPVNIRFEPPKTTDPCIIFTSTEFVRSVMDNLIKNSIEAMPDGGEISLDWVYDSSTETVLIGLSDSGPGIQEDLLKRLMNGDAVSSSKRSGSGIGVMTILAMLRRIGGQLDASSREGHGVHWSITIPSNRPAVTDLESEDPDQRSMPFDVSSVF